MYQDPVELIWVDAAKKLGMQIDRRSDVFAAWDGIQTLSIGTAETLDADDSLAQMIFHELCHWIVEGPDAFGQPDWGLDYDEPQHAAHEHACLRLQCALADSFGLRDFMASTTDFREYFDSLPDDPLEADAAQEGNPIDPAIPLASTAYRRIEGSDVQKVLYEALSKTREIAHVVQEVAPEKSLWRTVPRKPS